MHGLESECCRVGCRSAFCGTRRSVVTRAMYFVLGKLQAICMMHPNE